MTISLSTEKRNKHLFIYGTWFLGEIRLSYDELTNFRSEKAYSNYTSHKEELCRSCNQKKDPSQLNILHIDGESLTICIECKTELQKTINDFITENSQELSIELL